MRYWMYQYKRTWRGSITTSFLYPVLYLAAMGVGLGSLVNHTRHRRRRAVPRLHRTRAARRRRPCRSAANESMYPVMAAIKWLRTYFAMLATPLTGHRRARRPPGLDRRCGCLMVTSIYLAIMAAFGTVHSALAVLAIPVGVLTGLAFAAPIAAFAAAQQNDTGFSTIYRFGLIPLFLFRGPSSPSAAPGLAPARRPGHAALPRRSAVPGPRARPARPRPRPARTSPTWSC